MENNEINDAIQEAAQKRNVKIYGLEDIPTIIQGRPLFDFEGCDEGTLKNFGHDPDDIFQAAGKFNIALFPDGRVEGLKTVSSQYKVVQHNEAIMRLFNAIPDMYELTNIDIHTSTDGGNCVAYFKSDKKIEVVDGDVLQPRTVMKNSADASIRFMVNSAMWRLVCSNGMMAPDSRFDNRQSKKLHKGSLDLDREVGKFIESVETNIEKMGMWGKYAEKQLKAPDMNTIFEQLKVGPRVQEELMATPLRGEGKTVQAQLDADKLTGWDLYNSFTQRITDSDSTESVKIENGLRVSNVFEKYINAA